MAIEENKENQSKKPKSYMIPRIWHFGKLKTMEMVKG
jgi:hypothetical protein